MRDRYIAQRFPQISEPHIALKKTPEVLQWARQFLDDDRPQMAEELMHLALQEDITQREPWLFLIEAAFLREERSRFSSLVAEFKQRFAGDVAIASMDAMGRELEPNNPQYAHVSEPLPLPEWSMLNSVARNPALQQKFHASVLEAMAYHLPRQ
jgi:pilus assembly protein FimV